MNKQQLIDIVSHKIKEQTSIRYPKSELREIIDPVLETILETLQKGEDIQLNKFGHFSIKYKKGSPYYNINTGQKEIAPDKKLIHFTPHKGFRFDDSSGAPHPESTADNKQE